MLSGDIKEGVSVKGIKRFKQMLENQENHCRQVEFHTSFFEAKKLVTEIEDEFAQLSWAEGVPAPKDADGNVVPLTTEVMYSKGGTRLTVCRFGFQCSGWRKGRWTVFCTLVPNSTAQPYGVQELCLNRPDSWERLEKDIAAGEACSYFGNNSCPACSAFNYPTRNCNEAMAQDIVCRAKALAERDAKMPIPQP